MEDEFSTVVALDSKALRALVINSYSDSAIRPQSWKLESISLRCMTISGKRKIVVPFPYTMGALGVIENEMFGTKRYNMLIKSYKKYIHL